LYRRLFYFDVPLQESITQYSICIFLLKSYSNRIEDLIPLVPEIKRKSAFAKAGNVVWIGD